MEYKTNNNVVYSCNYHVVWCTKYRRKLLAGSVEKTLKEHLATKSKSLGVTLSEMEVMPDHVHLLLEVDPQLPVSTVIAELKGYTSYQLRKRYRHLRYFPALWTNPYFVATVGGAPLDIVKQYIEDQKRK